MSGEGDVAPKFDYPAMDFETAQPYPVWERARGECPVIQVSGMSLGVDGTTFQVTRWDDVEHVLRDPETFSSSINAEHIGQFMGDLILAMDGKEHRSYRNLVAPAFRASQLEKWGDSMIGPTIGALLDDIAPLGRADLVRDITSKYPVRVICAIVGVPVEDSAQFHEWAEQINGGPLHPEVGMKASRAMREYLEPLVEERRANPCGDLLSDLVHAEVDGEQLSDERIYGFLRLLLPAGAETTFRVMGNALTALLTNADVMERVMADRSLLPLLIEETLRWESSVTQVSRVATPRHRGRRLPGACRLVGERDHGLGQPRRDSLRPCGGVRPRPPDPGAHRVRHRSAPVPRDAPGEARAADGARRDPRPAPEPAARPRRAEPAHPGPRVPRPRRAARPVRLEELGEAAGVGEVPVLAVRRDQLVAERGVHRHRLGLLHPRLEDQPPVAEPASTCLELEQQRAADAASACARRGCTCA